MCQFWKTNYGLIVFRELILDQKQTALNVSKFDFKCRMYRLVLNAFIQTERFQMRLQEKKEEKEGKAMDLQNKCGSEKEYLLVFTRWFK